MALLSAAVVQAAESPFPLQVGNKWTLETRSSDILHIEVERSRQMEGQTWYLVSGYAPAPVWVRHGEDGELLALDPATAKVEKLAHLKLGVPYYWTKLGGCEQDAHPAPAPPVVDTQNYLLEIRYEPAYCRDVGLTREQYRPGVGLVQRAITTLRGELVFNLVYAKVGEKAVLSPDGTVVLHYDFHRGAKGWLAGFTDYSLLTGDLRTEAEIRALPDELGGGRGFYLQGMNRSDDLFMFLKKQAATEDGLAAKKRYRVSFDLRFASNAPSGCAGVGGAPGESVYLKAGVSTDEPLAVLSGSDVAITIDKGQQASGGKQAGVVGNIANGLECTPQNERYVRLVRHYEHPEAVTTDDRGWLWLLVGTDSAFEGLTGLYYESVTVRIKPAEEPAAPSSSLRGQ